ncbi:MAG TPA: SCO family protein [Chitinophagales bacterium]|nr:SCO family protein [Chitinophagales bacterium]
MRAKYLLLLSSFILLFGCNTKNALPVYGNKTVVVNSEGKTDSIDYVLPDFGFVNQDSQLVSLASLKDKIIVTEFFFTACPSICPKMQAQMLRVYEKYKADPNVVILAFTIDPARDSVGRLKAYEAKLGIESSKWHLLTGNKDSIYAIAENFLVSAAEDPDAPGGHVHSGNFILVDKQKRLRGYYDGTKDESVTKLLEETDILLGEKQ